MISKGIYSRTRPAYVVLPRRDPGVSGVGDELCARIIKRAGGLRETAYLQCRDNLIELSSREPCKRSVARKAEANITGE